MALARRRKHEGQKLAQLQSARHHGSAIASGASAWIHAAVIRRLAFRDARRSDDWRKGGGVMSNNAIIAVKDDAKQTRDCTFFGRSG
jgi:hypothetical protein